MASTSTVLKPRDREFGTGNDPLFHHYLGTTVTRPRLSDVLGSELEELYQALMATGRFGYLSRSNLARYPEAYRWAAEQFGCTRALIRIANSLADVEDVILKEQTNYMDSLTRKDGRYARVDKKAFCDALKSARERTCAAVLAADASYNVRISHWDNLIGTLDLSDRYTLGAVYRFPSFHPQKQGNVYNALKNGYNWAELLQTNDDEPQIPRRQDFQPILAPAIPDDEPRVVSPAGSVSFDGHAQEIAEDSSLMEMIAECMAPVALEQFDPVEFESAVDVFNQEREELGVMRE